VADGGVGVVGDIIEGEFEMTKEPDWEGFGRAMMGDWPTNGIDGSDLFCMAQNFGLVREIAGGFNPDEHIDAEGISPEAGDDWYEYNFGPVADRTKETD
tara:strand:- start:1379 stop:1675 length:297 start_codon:yes stop_codon:yes gene_type:complete